MFLNVASLVKNRRMELKLSQKDLTKCVGYKNIVKSQFISNIERGICGIPLKDVPKFSEILNLPIEDFKKAYIKDMELKFDIKIKEFSPAPESIQSTDQYN
jgi:transcriptional regulator with XRE-family HTH domain